VQASGVVEPVDVAGDCSVGFGFGFVHAGGFFVLERGEETFGDCVVQTGGGNGLLSMNKSDPSAD